MVVGKAVMHKVSVGAFNYLTDFKRLSYPLSNPKRLSNSVLNEIVFSLGLSPLLVKRSSRERTFPSSRFCF